MSSDGSKTSDGYLNPEVSEQNILTKKLNRIQLYKMDSLRNKSFRN